MGNLVMKGLKDLYKGKRVLVTGDTGFKGSWLCLWLKMLGADVLGFALPPHNKNDHYNLLVLDKIVKHIDGDIRNYSALKRICNNFQPEIIFHLAAQSLVRVSYKEPKLTFDTNAGGFVNIMEVVLETSSLRAAVMITSDKCYKNKEWIWGYRENDEIGGYDPYSGSKAAAELIFSSYFNSFSSRLRRKGLATVRAGNVIGGGDWAVDRIVPDCIRSLENNKPIVLRHPNAIRPWQHVLEPLSGYLQLAKKLYFEPKKFSGSWNFGPKIDSMHTVKELAQAIVHFWGNGEIKIKKQKDIFHESGLLFLNCDKSAQLLRWQPKWDFVETVANTVSWYKGLLAGESAYNLTTKQIQGYMLEGKND